jgi:phosphate starvation-inducible PhoH-like protein
MSKIKADLLIEIEEGLDDYKKKKYMASKAKKSLSKKEFSDSQIELTPKQQTLYKGIRNNTLTLVHGPAGTSKTFTSCYTALGLYVDGKVDNIIITKPIQESGEQLGHLPGSVDEKIAPFMKSYISNFAKIIGQQATDFMVASGAIIVEPLAYMRGATYDDSFMMLDECQNASMKQLMLWSTRLGRGSKMIMMGDTSQFDVRRRDSGFNDFISMVDKMPDLLSFKFENSDIVRNKFLIELTNRYDKYRSGDRNESKE